MSIEYTKYERLFTAKAPRAQRNDTKVKARNGKQEKEITHTKARRAQRKTTKFRH